jgi:hypothetical protein
VPRLIERRKEKKDLEFSFLVQSHRLLQMYCHHCGNAQSINGDKTCTKCGEEFISEEELKAFREWQRNQKEKQKPDFDNSQTKEFVLLKEITLKSSEQPKPVAVAAIEEHPQRSGAFSPKYEEIKTTTYVKKPQSRLGTHQTGQSSSYIQPTVSKDMSAPVERKASFSSPKICSKFDQSPLIKERCIKCNQLQSFHDQTNLSSKPQKLTQSSPSLSLGFPEQSTASSPMNNNSSFISNQPETSQQDPPQAKVKQRSEKKLFKLKSQFNIR